MNAQTGQLLDGKKTSQEVRAEVALVAARLIEKGTQPGLTVVLVGEDPASEVYVRNKDRAATNAGFLVRTVKLPADTGQDKLMSVVQELGSDKSVHGILVQLPLPKHLDSTAIIEAIPPGKDVDGLTLANVGALAAGRDGLVPCTPAGCIEILDRYGYDLAGKDVVVVGRSQLVGKPIAQLLLARNATVTICHSRTKDLAAHCKRADVVIAAVGIPRLIQGDWIRPGAMVLDVGINRGEDGKLVGDVDFEAAKAHAGGITPVPGGIGPMTIAMLLANTVQAAARSIGSDLSELGWRA